MQTDDNKTTRQGRRSAQALLHTAQIQIQGNTHASLQSNVFRGVHYILVTLACTAKHWPDPWPLHEAWALFWGAQLFWSDTP